MKTFHINLQTTLFLTDHSVLAAYNEHSSLVVYNKPLVDENLLREIISTIQADGKQVSFTYQTDCFGVNFYDHLSGGTSLFSDVVGKKLIS